MSGVYLKPYRAEFGAIYHEAAPGFLFTVSPPTAAAAVAEAMNKATVYDAGWVAREIIRDLLSDLTSPFPLEAVAVAALGMGDTSIERAQAYLAATPPGANK